VAEGVPDTVRVLDGARDGGSVRDGDRVRDGARELVGARVGPRRVYASGIVILAIPVPHCHWRKQAVRGGTYSPAVQNTPGDSIRAAE